MLSTLLPPAPACHPIEIAQFMALTEPETYVSPSPEIQALIAECNALIARIKSHRL